MAELKKTLGFQTIFALTITAMIGTGMFFGVSIGSGIAGNVSLLSWAVLGVITVYVSMCFGELISMFPTAGGVYEFSKRAYGRFISFFVGWLTWIVGNVTTAVLIVAAVDYASGGAWAGPVKILVSILIILGLNIITLIGIEAAGGILIFFASITIAMLLSIVVPGFWQINPGNFQPFFTHDWTSMFVVIFFIVETYFGWESASFLAEETKDAKKTIPPALIFSTVVVATLGLGLAIVTLGSFPWDTVASQSLSLLSMAELMFPKSVIGIINIAIIITLVGSAMGGIVSAPRLLLALSRDKLFIEQFGAIHKKFKTPHKAIFFQTAISILIVLAGAFSGSGIYTSLLSILVPLALLMYMFVIIAVPVFRRKLPNIERPFKAWGGKYIPIIICLIYTSVIIIWAINEESALSQLYLAGSFIFWGIPVYIMLNMFYNPDWLIKITNVGSIINLWLENFFLPKSVIREILVMHPRLEEKQILELGSGVGTLTIWLSRNVGREGQIFAIDFSEKNTRILEKRLIENRITNVEAIHDNHLVNRIPPDINYVDAVFSVGFLSYMQDVRKILKEIADILPENGRVVLVDYLDLFWFIPNRAWVSDRHKVEEYFREAGFSVNIIIKQKLFWKMIYINGIKTEHEVPVL